MTDLSSDDLRALLAAASPGPWKLVEEHNFDCVLDLGLSATVYDADGDKVCADTVGGLWAMSVEDARLIALAPALAAEVIRLRQENDRLSQRVENLWEALGDMLDDCEPDRPGAPRLSIREAARAAFKGGDYEA